MSVESSGRGTQFFRSFLYCDDILVGMVDRDLTLTYVDGGGWNKLRIVHEEFLGKSLLSICENYPFIIDSFVEALDGHSRKTCICVENRNYLFRVLPVFGRRNETIGASGFAIDITGRTDIFIELDRSLYRQHRQRSTATATAGRSFQNVLLSGFAVVDSSLRFEYADAIVHRLFGLSDGELSGRFLKEFLTMNVLPTLELLLRDLGDQADDVRPVTERIVVRKADSKSTLLDLNIIPIPGIPPRLAFYLTEVEP